MTFGGERRGRFRNRLQYFYSISVFLGVLVSAYLMMEKESGARLPVDSIQATNTLRLDAGVGDEALARLIEVEKELISIRENSDRPREMKRTFGKPFAVRP